MKNYYIALIVFVIIYMSFDVLEYIILKRVKNVKFKNYFDYKINYKKYINEMKKLQKMKKNENKNTNTNIEQ